MHTIQIQNQTPDWEDDVLSLPVRARLIGWPCALLLALAMFIPGAPLWVKVAEGVTAGLCFLVLNLDAGWRQKQDMNLRHATELVSKATSIDPVHVRPALLAAAQSSRSIMHGGEKMSIERSDFSFVVTVSSQKAVLTV